MAVTLSQIRGWSTDHLTNAAGYWTKTADQWEDAFLTMRNQSHTMVWKGAGGDALRQRTGADYSLVSGKADSLRQAAGVARSGASDITSAKRSALNAVEDAQNAGFDVGEDLSVSYDDHGGSAAEQAARQAKAVELASQIWSRAGQLEATDQKVAGQLTTATAGVGNGGFAQASPSNPPGHAPATKNNGVKLVDFTQDNNANGPTPPPFAPWDTPDGKPPAQPVPGPQPKSFDQHYKENLTLPGDQQPPQPAVPLPTFGAPPDPGPPLAPGPPPVAPPIPSYGQCVEGKVKATIGTEMVKSGFEQAVKGAIGGAVGGAVITPEIGGVGGIPGAVAGFVGGFTKGLVEAPVKALVEGAVECADVPIPGKP